MEIKFNKKNVFTAELSTSEKKIKAQKVDVTFELDSDDIDGAIVDHGSLQRLRQLEKNTIEDVSMIRRSVGARYGSVVSINEKTHWTILLMSRNATDDRFKKTSISSVLDDLLNHATNPGLISNQNALPGNMISSNENLNRNIQGLYKVFYCKDDSPEIKKLGLPSSSVDLKELFIPNITYHVIPLFRFLLLSLISPKLLANDELDLIRTLIPDTGLPEKGLDRYSDPFMTESNHDIFKDKLSNLEIDFIKIYKNCKKIINNEQKKINVAFNKNTKKKGSGAKIEPQHRREFDIVAQLTKKYSDEVISKNETKSSNKPKSMREHWRITGPARSRAQAEVMVASLSKEDIVLFSERFKLIAELSKKAGDLKFAN